MARAWIEAPAGWGPTQMLKTACLRDGYPVEEHRTTLSDGTWGSVLSLAGANSPPPSSTPASHDPGSADGRDEVTRQTIDPPYDLQVWIRGAWRRAIASRRATRPGHSWWWYVASPTSSAGRWLPDDHIRPLPVDAPHPAGHDCPHCR
jgi:hypothetical protein